ncbi:MAG: UDP-galactopyranose mutase [Clostridia bacterium]|nr:UDP-galactopyranose mutase [Clostridia bacterium]
MKKYDYLIVGAGLFGSTFAYEAKKKGKRCLVIDKREHIGGNVYCQQIEGINVHKYGAHIFHTSNKEIWDYVNSFATFNDFINSPLAVYKSKAYNLPFNMNTFKQMWGVEEPEQAKAIIDSQVRELGIKNPKNLEEKALSLVGTDIYERLIKGYTQKQWQRSCDSLPPSIIERIPIRFTYDNNYFNDTYQGIPIGGYNVIIEKMLHGTEVKLGTDYFELENREEIAEKTIFTGPIDRFFNYQLGELEYRSIRLDTRVLDCPSYQGNAVINYCDIEIPYTRVIEHKYFEYGAQPKTVVSWEYSTEWTKNDEPFYPINDAKNNELYQKYVSLAEKRPDVIFGGRLGQYKYYDMDRIIESALDLAKRALT